MSNNDDWLKDLIRSSASQSQPGDIDEILTILRTDVLRGGFSNLSREEIIAGIRMAIDIYAASRAPIENAHLRTEQQVFAFNKLAVLNKLQQMGADEAEVRYSGGGDEGRLDDVSVEPSSGDLGTTHVTLIYRQSTWDPDRGEHTTVNTLVETDLYSALGDLCWAAIDVSGNGAFEVGGGGSGTLTIDVRARSVILEHTDYFTESRTVQETL